MRLNCPECQATYDIPDSLIAAGRRVRCASCGHTWAASPPAPAVALAPEPIQPEPIHPVPEPSPEPEPDDAWPVEPPPEAPRHRVAPPRAERWAIAGWAATCLVLALAGGAAFEYRAAVMRAWPPSARAYAALGLARPGDPMGSAPGFNGGSAVSR